MTEYTPQIINREARTDPVGFVAGCCEEYKSRVKAVLESVVTKNTRILMLAGPSASGKTTSAQIIRKALEKMSLDAQTVSLDDFYLASFDLYPKDKNGNYDFETVHALDLPLMGECFSRLREKGECEMPLFDFKAHGRSEKTKKVTLNSDSLLIVEGLHALNPVVTSRLAGEGIAKVYVSVSSRVYNSRSAVLLSKRDLRLIRRTVRDNRDRDTSAKETFVLWKSVLNGENKYLFPFEKLADAKIDSFHACEPCMFANEACELFKQAGQEETAQRLLKALELFEPLPKELLCGDCLLNEFLG